MKDVFQQKRDIPVAILAVVLVAAMGLVASQRGNIKTFLGGLALPPEGQGAGLAMLPNVGDALAAPGSYTWSGEIAANQNVTVRLQYVMPASVNNNVPLSAVDAVLHFDPAFFEVAKDPVKGVFTDPIKASYDNTAGTVEFAAGNPYPGKTFQATSDRTLGSVTLHPKKVGSTTLSFDYGTGRGSGLSHVVVVDNNGAAVDILDKTESANVTIRDAKPVIASTDTLTPARGITNSDAPTKVYLTGKFFGTDSVVKLNSSSGTVYQFNPLSISQDGTKIIFEIPTNFSGIPGSYNIGVTSAGQTGWKGSNSFYLSPVPTDTTSKYYPVIDSAAPTAFTAKSQQTQNITVTGTRFSFTNGTLKVPVTGVQILNKDHMYSLTNVVVNATGTQVTAVIPASVEPGTYDLQVLYDSRAATNGTSDTLPNAITFGEVPTISQVFPASVSTDYTNGLPLEISGKNFGSDKSNISVRLAGPQSVTLSVNSVSEGTESVAASILASSTTNFPEGQYDVVVDVNGQSQTLARALTVTGAVVPKIISSTPSMVEFGYTSSTKIQISGEDLNRTQSIEFKNATQSFSAASFTVASVENGNSVTLDVVLPNNLATNTYAAKLTLINGQSTEYAYALTVTPPAPTPVVASVAPNNVTDGYSGTPQVVITGTNFGTTPFVTLVGTKTYSVTATQSTDTQITGTIPNGMEPGMYKTSVASRGKTGTLENAFEVKQKPAPTISGVSPSTIEIGYADKTPVTVTGTNFRTGSKVRIEGPATYEFSNPVVSSDFTKIDAQLPAGIQLGQYKLIVYGGGNDPVVSASIQFVITQTPQKVLAPTVTNNSNAKFSTQLSASWTLPAGSPAPQYYQYRVLDNGNEIRGWTDEKIQLATSVVAKGLNLLNGHSYAIQVRGVNAAGTGDVATSAATATSSANIDHDANEKVGLNDLKLLGLAVGRKDKPMEDINQSGLVSFDDLGILLGQWNP
jgi:hypothetical protein